MSESIFGAVSLGLTAAVAWGAADFTGGVATKRNNVYGVVIGAEFVGLLLLTPIALLLGESGLELKYWFIAGLGGLCGSVGLTLLYRALASDQMSVAAPVSAVMGAVIPVFVGMSLQGLPEITAILGIGLALVAILLISRSETADKRAVFKFARLALPLAAGIFFGFYFVFLHQAGQTSRILPIIAARLGALIFLIPFASATERSWLPDRKYLPLIALSGILDTCGNFLYISAGQLGRLDIAAVLSSLYPASTVVMAWLILKEHVSIPQIIGIATAFLAIFMIVS